MRQKLFFSIALLAFIGITTNAQVGIGTVTPAATADITATNSTGATTNVDGILIPRVDRQRALAMASVPNSTMIYVNSIATGTATGQAVNITSTGFYYFDTTSTTWIKISTGTTDWTLIGNAATTAGTNFIGTTDAVDFVTKSNNTERLRVTSGGNVGIGTAAPAAKLDIATGATVTNSIVNATGSINDFLQYNIQNTSTGTQAQSGYSATADNGTATTGFAWVGINNSAFNFPTAYNIGGANDVSYIGSGQDMYVANANNTKSIIFSTGKAASPFFNERMRITNGGTVGIGTTTPASTLDITALNPTGATTNVDGILIPRVDRQRALGMASVPNSTIIYVNSIATGTATGQAINITSTGFYYFDTTSTTWIKIQTGTPDWTLTGNTGTTAGTNFIGTTDAIDLRIKTAGTDRFNISNANNGQLQSYSIGTAALPVYSYQADPNTGAFSPAADMFAVTTGGTERLRVNNNGAVGIGTTTPNGALDVNATASNYGFVPPRVALTASNVQAPVTNPQGGAPLAGTVVYNTATAGSSPNNVGPGLYYWNGSRWVAFAGSPGGLDWTLTGNAGTTVGTNFIGTTDAVDFATYTNNTEKMRVGSNGSVTINTGAVPSASEKFQVNHTGAGNDAMLAINNDDTTGKGNAIWAKNTNATGVGIIASSGATPPNVLPTTGAGISGSHVDGYGVYASCGNGGPNTPAHNGHAAGGFVLDSDNSVATNNSSAFAKLAGKDNLDPDGIGLVTANTLLYGGYFQGGVGGISYSYAGLLYNHNAAGTTGTNYKIIGNGAASTIIPDENNIPRVMFCTEAPEVLFEDYGVSQLTSGEAYINIDKILAKSLKVDAKHPLKVFIQLEGDCNGVYVTEKSIKGFKVKELNRGNSNVNFSWHIVGTRADSRDANGKLTSEFENLRLPIGPTRLKEDKLVQKENPKTTNQESNTK